MSLPGVSQVSKALHEGVIYRHIILTVPAMFRTTFYHNAAVVLRAFMRCGAQCLEMILQLSSPVQEHLRTWLSKHLNQIQKRE